MATLLNRGNGRRAIQFENLDGKRKTLGLGKCPAKSADAIKTKVEAILACKLAQTSFDSETARWVASLANSLHDRLAEFGLVESRQPTAKPVAVTLVVFLNDYLERRNEDVKGGTSVFYGHTVRNLTTFFGEAKTLAEVTPGDADDFRRHLQKTEKLSAATVVRRCALARTFIKDAIRRKLIDSNPFDGVGRGSTANPDRQRFIDQATIAKVIDACPNAEWRLLVALSRFAGLRVPSEPLLLRWQDIDLPAGRMLVHSPKTEHHAGKATRMVPIFPELRPYLEDAHELAVVGAEFVLPSLRKPGAVTGDWRSVNLGTMFGKIIKRAGLVAWPRAWHNLRSSRQTELTETFPSHVVTAWLGNSERIAEKHYLQVLDSHFERASTPSSAAPALRNTSETLSTASQPCSAANAKPLVLSGKPTKQGVCVTGLMGDTGFEPVTSTV